MTWKGDRHESPNKMTYTLPPSRFRTTHPITYRNVEVQITPVQPTLACTIIINMIPLTPYDVWLPVNN